MHIYESHMGGFYANKELLPTEELYCSQCNDYDEYIGEFDNGQDFLSKINSDFLRSLDYDIEYLLQFCEETWGDKNDC